MIYDLSIIAMEEERSVASILQYSHWNTSKIFYVIIFEIIFDNTDETILLLKNER